MTEKELKNLSKDELIDIIKTNELQQNLKKSSFSFGNSVVDNLANALYEFDLGVLITDAQLDKPGPKILFANKGICKMTGYSEEELLGTTPRILQGNKTSKKVLKRLRNTIHIGDYFQGSTVNYRKDGTEFHNQWGIQPISDINGNITHYVSLHGDLTALKRKEEQLANQINQKNAFFNILAHDLRNPLTGFLTLTGLMKDKMMDLSLNKMLELIKQLSNTAEGLNDLLSNLLTWSRAQTDKVQIEPINLNLHGAIEDSIKVYNAQASEKSIQLVNKVPKNLNKKLDPSVLDIILRNLINNAIKYSHAGSVVEIGCDSAKHSIFIKDYGIGIPEKKVKNLFNVGTKTSTPGTHDEKGTGLGLLLSKELALKHEGDITLESKLGKGTTFYFELPED